MRNPIYAAAALHTLLVCVGAAAIQNTTNLITPDLSGSSGIAVEVSVAKINASKTSTRVSVKPNGKWSNATKVAAPAAHEPAIVQGDVRAAPAESKPNPKVVPPKVNTISVAPNPGVSPAQVKVVSLTGIKAMISPVVKPVVSSEYGDVGCRSPQLVASVSAKESTFAQASTIASTGDKVHAGKHGVINHSLPLRAHAKDFVKDKAPFRNLTMSTAAQQSRGFKPCIEFTSDLETWYWTRQYPWGDDSGSSKDLQDGKMCVPRHKHGGALFISAHPSPTAGTTKLECHFPEDSDDAFCNISLVDGYSLPVTCTMGESKMGGEIDLWQNEYLCRDQSRKHLGVCMNNKEERGEEYVADFFQSSVSNGHKYCIWTGCRQIYKLHVKTPVRCHVGSTKLSPAAN